MSERLSRFVPIEDAQTPTTRFVVNFPEFVDKDRIGVNLRAINTLCRIGGIRHVRVVSNSDGDRTNFVPIIVGFDEKGQAVAGKAGIKTSIPIFTAESEQNRRSGGRLPHAATWIDTTITVNTNEMVNRIADDSKWEQGARSSKAWAHHLNTAVKEGITNSGFKHLTIGLSRGNWRETALHYALMSFVAATNSSARSAAFGSLAYSASMNLVDFVMLRGGAENFRWSLMYGPQLDRALVLQLVSKRATLIKDFSQDTSQSLPPAGK